MNIEYKSISVDLQENSSGGFEWVGYVAGYGNIDSYGDIVERGAFAEQIGQSVPAFFEHETPCGKMTIVEEDDYGLKVSGELMPDEIQNPELGKLSERLRWFMSNGIKYSMSIGYVTEGKRYETMNGREIRVLTKLKLKEGSLVLNPANENAVITGYKSGDALTMETIKAIDPRQLEKMFIDGNVQMSKTLAKTMVSKVKNMQQEEESGKMATELSEIAKLFK